MTWPRKTSRAIIFLRLLVALLPAVMFPLPMLHAQEENYEQPWSYQTGSLVYGVSVSADGEYVAAGSRDDRVYFFSRSGELL